ncbi:hypothetical protein [uncultured Sphingomonas sp.]|uniref:hypothetical protein n=1 Tax=uncultured Sphingomonas sp. TaxID=158754 RepID=UPI0030F60C4E
MTIEQGIGMALMMLFLADIFLTVLYARAGTGLLAPYWNRAVWASLRLLASISGKRGGTILSLAGPLIIILLIGFWSLGLTVGAALVIQPELGTAIRPSTGSTPTDFVTALMVAGNSLSIVGGGDDTPHTSATRLLFLLNSLIGASVLSLVLSYLVQVYSALRERNALALAVDLMTDGTGDAAEALARLLPGGDGSSATSEIGNLARSLAAIKEAHHFYPLLFYFRFDEPRYSVSRLSFVILDLTSLIDSALDRGKYASLIDSTSLTSLRRAGLLLLQTLDRKFASVERRSGGAEDEWRYRQSYGAAVRTLTNAGITARPGGVERYVTNRRAWEPLIRHVAPALGDAMNQIDRRKPAPTHELPAQQA